MDKNGYSGTKCIVHWYFPTCISNVLTPWYFSVAYVFPSFEKLWLGFVSIANISSLHSPRVYCCFLSGNILTEKNWSNRETQPSGKARFWHHKMHWMHMKQQNLYRLSWWELMGLNSGPHLNLQKTFFGAYTQIWGEKKKHHFQKRKT